MAKEYTTELAIIGSGFVGQTIAKELSRDIPSLLLIDVSKTSISFDHPEQEHYSDLQLAKTAKPSGGVEVWGTALTKPTSEQYFADPRFEDWNVLGEKLPFSRAAHLFGVKDRQFRFTSHEKRKVSRHFPNLWKHFQVEIHTYGRSKSLKFGWALDQTKAQPNLSGRVIAISKLLNGWQVSLDTGSEQVTVLAKDLVLASGAVGNAALAHMATGEARFPIGNHISASIGSLGFSSPKTFSKFPNTFRPGERGFVTLSRAPTKSNSPRVGIRFQGLEDTGDTSSPPAWMGTLGVKVAPHIRNFKARIGLSNAWSIRLMLEHGGDDTRSLSITSSEKGVSCLVNSEISIAAKTEVARALEGLSSYFKESLYSLELSAADSLSWSDAAHYYGTIPMRKSVFGELVVNPKYGIVGYEGLYAVGASAFPRGSHAHPTYLSVCLAMDFTTKFRG
jgi:choline dehydrogenase-like flavoprotein